MPKASTSPDTWDKVVENEIQQKCGPLLPVFPVFVFADLPSGWREAAAAFKFFPVWWDLESFLG